MRPDIFTFFILSICPIVKEDQEVREVDVAVAVEVSGEAVGEE